jgi:adenine-specific DNA-methyltransferase
MSYLINNKAKTKASIKEKPSFSSSTSPVWRPIHYLGSKLRLVDIIRNALDTVDSKGGPVCDLFAGSGTVSFALSSGRDVTAVDIQEYSRTICSAILNPCTNQSREALKIYQKVKSSSHTESLLWAAQPLIDYEVECLELANRGKTNAVCDLIENGSLYSFINEGNDIRDAKLTNAFKLTKSRLKREGVNNKSSLILRYFGGLYFSYEQAVQLDALLSILPDKGPLRDPLLAAILSTTSDLVNTVGKQFAQPIKPRNKSGEPKKHLIRQISRDRSQDCWPIFCGWLEQYSAIPNSGRTHRAIKADYQDFLNCFEGDLSVVYADPPYTRDHYSRFYHVLETVCLRDDPKVSSMRVRGQDQLSRGVYRVGRHQSPFCIKTQAPAAFDALFSGVRKLDASLVLSYSPYSLDARGRPRVMTVEAIRALARKHFKSVEISSAGKIAHSKLNHSDLNTDIAYNAELFLICQP